MAAEEVTAVAAATEVDGGVEEMTAEAAGTEEGAAATMADKVVGEVAVATME